MTAPALGLTLRPARSPEPRTPGWGSWLTAIALTLLLGSFMASGLVVRSGWIVPRADTAEPPPERILYMDVPPAALPLPPAPAAAAGTATPDGVLPRAATPLPLPAAPSASRPVAPPFPVAPTTARDTAGAPAAALPGTRRPSALAPRVLIPDPSLRPSLPPPPSAGDRVAPRATCAAPCLGGTTVGTGIGRSEMTREEQAERLRAIGRAVPEMAARRGEPNVAPAEGPKDPGAPKILQGTSIPVGLPWGGPTKAERERDARLHAENSVILERIRARVDSQVVRDSLARRDSIERARRAARPPG